MKNNSQYTSFEKYQMNPQRRNKQNKYINSTEDNLSFEIPRNFFYKTESNLNQYSTLDHEFSQVNKIQNCSYTNYNLNQGKYILNNNKEYFYRSCYEMPTYQSDDYQMYEYYDYNSLNIRPFPLYSQSIDNTKQNTIKRNNKSNAEEKRFPSNYSYYESKYTNKKKNESKNINNIKLSNNYYKGVNPPLNENDNKNHILTKKGNDRYDINNSPSTKNDSESIYYKMPKDKINYLNNTVSDNNKRNSIFKSSYNINDSQSMSNDCNKSIKTIVQPRTPSSYVYQKIQSPIKRFETETQLQYQNMHSEINYNRSERNLPSKSFEKISFTKLINKKPINNNNRNFVKNIDATEDTNNNKSEIFKVNKDKIPYTPKQYKFRNYTKITANLNKDMKFKNNSTISIRDEDNKLFFKNDLQHNNKEHIKSQTELISRDRVNNKLKNENILEKKKKNNSQALSILNTDKLKKISTKSTDTPINSTNKKNLEVNDKNKINNDISLKKLKSYEEESNYMKEIENIMHDNYTEPKKKIIYNINGNKNLINYSNNEMNNKDKNLNNLSKGRIEPNKEISERNTIQTMSNKKNNSKNEKVNDNIKKSNYTNSNINNFEYENKVKNNEISNSNIKNNSNKNNDNNHLKKTPSNQIIHNREKSNEITENKKSSNNIKKNNNNTKTIPKKNVNTTDKNSSPQNNSNISKLNINSTNKKIIQKPHRNSDLLRHEARVKETQKKSEKTNENEEEWDNMQYKGMRKQTYDPGRRPGKKNKNKKNEKKNSSLDEEFSSTIYIKASEGVTIAGKNESGNKKTNQDTFILEKNVNGILNFNIFGVLDGHGEDGHFASQFVSRYIIYRIKNHPLIKKLDEPKKIYKKLIANGYEIIANIYLDADIQIQKEKFDVTRSGTTIVLVIQLEEHIICANTGDSRAIAIFDENYEDNLSYSKIYPLSYDCKPELPNEKKRIQQCGGVVEKAYYSDDEEDDDDPLPYRVWAKGEDYPGLAMSRSIGDMDAKKVGVIPNPQIVEYTIDYFSKYILMGSDGIWEFICNEDAMKIANKFYLRNDPKGLCHELTQKAIELWEEKDVVIDDITLIVVFF